MTVAVGLMVENGLVIGADTEQIAPGYFKMAASKIRGVNLLPRLRDGFTIPGASCTVAGAGPADYVESLADRINGEFCRVASNETSLSALDEPFHQTVRTFYQENVIPFANYPEIERPDVSLVIGAEMNGCRALWTTHKMIVNRVHPKISATAIGFGSLMAKSLLARLYRRCNLKSAILLAIYILYEAKMWVPDCGKDTEIVCISNGVIAPLPPEDIKAIEELFYGQESVEAIEQTTLHYLFGTKDYGDQKEILKLHNCVRDAIKRITDKWSWA